MAAGSMSVVAGHGGTWIWDLGDPTMAMLSQGLEFESDEVVFRFGEARSVTCRLSLAPDPADNQQNARNAPPIFKYRPSVRVLRTSGVTGRGALSVLWRCRLEKGGTPLTFKTEEAEVRSGDVLRHPVAVDYGTMQTVLQGSPLPKFSYGMMMPGPPPKLKLHMEMELNPKVARGQQIQPPVADQPVPPLRTRMAKMLQEEQFSDLTLICQGQKVRAHKCVLAAASPMFAAMFGGQGSVESRTGVVEIKDMSVADLKAFLHLIYTDSFTALEYDSEALFAACCKYDVQDLKAKCLNALVNTMSVENVVNRLMLARRHDATLLKKAAMAYIVNNMKEVAKTKEWQDLKESKSDIPDMLELFASQ